MNELTRTGAHHEPVQFGNGVPVCAPVAQDKATFWIVFHEPEKVIDGPLMVAIEQILDARKMGGKASGQIENPRALFEAIIVLDRAIGFLVCPNEAERI